MKTLSSHDRSFSQDVLNALPSHIAVLDQNGVIVAVNSAWTRFARENRGDAQQSIGIGANYLEVARQSVGPYSDEAQAAYTGIKAVLDRSISQFSLEYPCHSPAQQRWFLLQAAPMQSQAENTAVVIHSDISQRKHSEQLTSFHADVADALSSGTCLQTMLQRCAESVVAHLHAAFARIWTLDEKENVLELQASAGCYTHLTGKHSRIAMGEYEIGQIAQQRRPRLTNSIQDEQIISDTAWAKKEGMVAFAGYPLLIEDRVVGVIALFSRSRLADTTVAALAPVASQIALWVERQSHELALHDSEERFRELIAHIHHILWMIDARESKLVYISPVYEEIWGRTCQSLIENPHSYMEGVHPLDLDMMKQADALMYQTGHIDVECRVLRPDETIRWVWVRGDPIVKNGQIVRIVGVIEDITEKRTLAAERDALLSRLQLHIERMPLGYLLFDAQFRIADWNPAAERIFGYTKAEMLGKGPPYIQFVPGSFWQQGKELLNRFESGDMGAHSLNENITKDGRKITCQWFNTPLLLENGQSAGFLSLVQDVTDRKLLEEHLRQAQKMEAVGNLAGGIAHDFNNLLTIINGYSHIIHTKDTVAEPMRAFAGEIHQAGERAAALTRQLLAFSRKQVLEPKILSLNNVVTNIERMLQRLIGEDIAMSVILDPALGPTKADPGQIEQVIMNLAVNARDAMPRGGKLTVETANADLDVTYTSAQPGLAAGPYVMLAVTDTGLGMDDATKARVFEPFFTTKEAGKGTGLGLATVFGIVKQSEGHAAVYSELGHGTTFKIYLPRVEVKNKKTAGEPSHAAIVKGSETILFTEDEAALRELGRRILEMYGYKVLLAASGDKAMQIAREYQGPIHLLLTDVVMPLMSGRQLAENLAILRPDTKVLYLSGYTDDAVVRHGVLEAETAFLQKPFTPGRLAQKVREVLDK